MWKGKSRSGKDVTLLNPSEKGSKFANELRENVKLTNDQHLKLDKFNRPQALSDTEASYRMGYLQSQKDSARCYKAKNKVNARNPRAKITKASAGRGFKSK